MFNRILVPLDGSKLAERAIPHAERFARIFGSTIVLLQVLEPSSYQENPNPVDPLSWQIRKTEADMYLQDVARRILANLGESAAPEISALPSESRPAGQSSESHTPVAQPESGDSGAQPAEEDRAGQKVQVEYAIREGRTAEHIVDFSHNENIDLLILTTHGASGLSRWNISSIVQKVISLVYLPVLLVRAFQSFEDESAAIHYRRILLPIDSSRRAECSLYAGIALVQGEMAFSNAFESGSGTTRSSETSPSGQAGSMDSTVEISSRLLLSAIIKPPEIPLPEPYPPEIRQLSEQLMHVSREAVNTYLNEMKARLPVECDVMMIENSNVSSAIHEQAKVRRRGPGHPMRSRVYRAADLALWFCDSKLYRTRHKTRLDHPGYSPFPGPSHRR